jgi:transcription elongation factor Elf1
MNGMDDEIKEEPTIKLYVHGDNYITFNCPECGYSERINLIKFKKVKTETKIKCKCSKILSCLIEFREKYRKKVNLYGKYRNVKTAVALGMKIQDISMA